ncbi:MAG: hypothetical protein IPO55_00045 [Alphaproteobacteria bacterium]|nr:hypothetical protein [Alphaproteobacteria bacterium]
MRLAYGISDNYEAFLAAGMTGGGTIGTASISGTDSYNTRARVAVNFTGKLRGDVYAGYIRQNFESGFDDVGAANYGGSHCGMSRS